MIDRIPKLVSHGTAYLLIFASILKSIDPYYFIYGLRSVFGTSVYPSFSLVGFVIASELLLAFWLLSGFKPKNSIVTAACVFIVFSSFHIYANTIGSKQPCGCLGPFWNSLNIKSHGWFDLSLAIVPAIFLIISLALIENSPSRINTLKRLSLRKSLLLTLLFISTLFLFSHKVSHRNIYGVKSLWGNFTSLNKEEVIVNKNIENRLKFLLDSEKNEILYQENLISLVKKIIHIQKNHQKNISMNLFNDDNTKQKHNNFQDNHTKSSPWKAIAFDRVSLRSIKTYDFFNTKNKKIDVLGLDMGDSLGGMVVPFLNSSKHIKDSIQGDLITFTFPIILENDERQLFSCVFSLIKNQWDLILYAKISNTRIDNKFSTKSSNEE